MTLLLAVAGFAPPAHADQWRDKQWYLEFLNAAQAHKITKGSGVTVAVVDTGVDGTHPDLKGNVLRGTDDAAGDGWRDTDGHGTGIASLIAGHGHGPGGRDGILGLAPEAKILPISGDSQRGLAKSTLKKASVVNLSLKRGGLALLADDALDADMVVVAAAGNTTQDADRVIPPANHPGVIAVSGLDENGEFAKESVQGPEVVLSAPAVNIAVASAGKREHVPSRVELG
ncbi:MAG: S8 family serine peptidase [Micromonosporaceae bacterium]